MGNEGRGASRQEGAGAAATVKAGAAVREAHRCFARLDQCV